MLNWGEQLQYYQRTSRTLEILSPSEYAIAFYVTFYGLSKCMPTGVCYYVRTSRSPPVPAAVLPFGDILANLVSTFAAFGHHYYSLWPKATTPERSQKLYLRPSVAKVRCGRRPQQLRSHR